MYLNFSLIQQLRSTYTQAFVQLHFYRDFFFYQSEFYTHLLYKTQLWLNFFCAQLDFFLFIRAPAPHYRPKLPQPPSFPARPQRGLTLICPLPQGTPWMDNSALQWGPTTIAKSLQLEHIARLPWPEGMLTAEGDHWTAKGIFGNAQGNHRC